MNDDTNNPTTNDPCGDSGVHGEVATCEDLAAVLSAFVDDELAPENRLPLERHLARCAACRRLVDETEALDRGLAMMIDDDARAGLGEGFVGAVLARTVYEGAEEAAPSSFRLAVPWLGWFAAAASLAVTAIVWQLGGTGAAIPGAGDGATAAAGPPAYQRPPAYLVSSTFDGVAEMPAQPWPEDETRAVEGDRDPLPTRFDPVPTPPAPAPAPELADARALGTAAIVLEELASWDGSSYEPVERARRISSYDELLPRLAAVSAELEDEGLRASLEFVRTMLVQLEDGPLAEADVVRMRDAVRRSDLPGMLLRVAGPEVAETF